MSARDHRSRARIRHSAIGLGAALALVAAGLGSSPAAADEVNGPLKGRLEKRLDRAPQLGKNATSGRPAVLSSRIDGDLAKERGPVTVMLELDTQAGTQAFTKFRSRGQRAARNAEQDARAASRRQARRVARQFAKPATRARELYRASGVYSGVAVRTDASRLSELGAIPGVRAIHTLTPKTISNASSVPLIGAPAAWSGAAGTGNGVKVGVIDTGIDYTHEDFGGNGNFEAADASDTDAGWETAKVVGGYDFVGDAYDPDPDSDTYNPVPAPDPDPLDCEGHGTHVSGTAAGYGVNANGSTYDGPWNSATSNRTFEVGPGVAPQASLYGLRVFGCEGSSLVIIPALEWANDHDLDVVNMSLGTDFGSPQDPVSVASNNLSAAGTVVVAAIGNAGDVYEIGGSPGNATRVIGAAASVDETSINDGFKVDRPANLEPVDTVDGTRDNFFAASRSAEYAWGTEPNVNNKPIVIVGDWSEPPSNSNNIDGCSPYSAADAAKVAGKIVLQMWLDGDGRRCGSAARVGNAATSGAVGALLGNDSNTFSAVIAGTDEIPAMLVIEQAADAVRSALASGPVRGTLSYRYRNSITLEDPGAVDTLVPFSSRGIGVAKSVKPDVAAPGVTIFSAGVGTADEGASQSGTSMASPHVAGQAALVLAAHPAWTPEQVKAAIMNTATQNVWTGRNRTGKAYGPERVGAGRVRVDTSVKTTVLAYNKRNAGAVSVSFGPMEVTRNLSRTKRIKVENTGSSAATFEVTYRPAHASPGASYSVSPSSVTVPAGRSRDLKVTLEVDKDSLRHVQDPTTDPDPLGIGVQRSFRTDASGRVLLTPTGGGSALRVPVWSAPRPASTMTQAGRLNLVGRGGNGAGQLSLTGQGVSQGSGAKQYTSTVSGFQLQMESPRIPNCTRATGEDVSTCVQFPDDRARDLKYVGSASDAPAYSGAGLDPYAGYADDPDCTVNCNMPPAMLSFGISTWGPWRTPSDVAAFDVLIDGNGDKEPDALLYNTRVTSATEGFDYFVSTTLSYPALEVIDEQLTNISDGSFENGLFNSDSIVMPVSLHSLLEAGVIRRSSPVSYQVVSFSFLTGLTDGDTSATARWKQLQVTSPGLQATGDSGLATLNTDLPGQKLAVRRDAASAAKDKPLGLLLLHHLNGTGDRAQVVQVE